MQSWSGLSGDHLQQQNYMDPSKYKNQIKSFLISCYSLWSRRVESHAKQIFFILHSLHAQSLNLPTRFCHVQAIWYPPTQTIQWFFFSLMATLLKQRVQFHNAAAEATHTPFTSSSLWTVKGDKHLLSAPQEMDGGDTLSSVHTFPTQKQLQVK